MGEATVGGWFGSVLAAWVLCASPAQADVYLVDQAGTEGFTDLQTALDTVPPGSTLLVKGDWKGLHPFVVRKSVTILGLTVDTYDTVVTSFDNHYILEIAAGPDDVVTLKDLNIQGHWCWGPSSQPIHGDAIVIESARSVSIVDCIVAGGGPGDPLWRTEACAGLWWTHGGHGVFVSGSVDTLVSEDSDISGGTGSNLGYDCGWDGGDAIRNPLGVTFLSNSTLVGDLPDQLSVTDALLGKPVTLMGTGFEPAGASLLFLATSLGPPIAIRQGLWFLDAPFLYLGAIPTDATGAFTLNATIPDDPALIGTTLVVQSTDLVRLSEPTILVPRRNKP